MKRMKFISSSYYAHRYVDADIESYYSNANLYVEGQLKFQELYPTDIIPAPIYVAGEALQYGTTTRYQQYTAPIVKGYAYEVNGYVEDYAPSFDSKYYDYIFECSSILKERMPEKTIATIITAPLDYGIIVFGMQQWIEMLLFEKSMFYEWLGRFTEYHNSYKQQLMQCGTDIIAVSNILLNNKIVPNKIIEEELIPFCNKNLDTTIPTLIHSSFMPVKESVKNLEKVATTMGYIINESDDLHTIIDMLTSPKMLVGNLGSDFLYKKTPQTIEKMAYNILCKMDDYEAFVLGTTGADLNLMTTDEQLINIYKGIERYEKEH